MARTAIVLACIAVLAVLAAACGRSGPPAVGKPAAQRLTLEQLRNAEYASQWTRSGKAPLVNGQYRESAAPGAATEVVVKATDFYAMGDLDGDGSEDAVIVLESEPGGSGVFFDLVPVLNRGGQARGACARCRLEIGSTSTPSASASKRSMFACSSMARTIRSAVRRSM